MKKRLSISIISIVGAVLLLCGWTAMAASSSGKATSASATGTFKSLSQDGSRLTVTTDKGDQSLTLAKSVWVYRNERKAQLSDLKPGDRIEAILNSKNQAAYIKALAEPAAEPVAKPAEKSTTESAAQPAQPAQPAAPTAPPAPPALSAAPAPQSPDPRANAGPKADAAPSAQGAYPGLDGLELNVDGRHFKLQIKQNHGKGGMQYELNLKPESGGAVHLQGDEAAAWIMELLAPVDLKSNNARQQLLQQIASHYGIDPGKLQIQLNAQWHEADDNGDDNVDHNDAKWSAAGKKAEKPEAGGKHGKSHGDDHHGDD